MRVHVKLYGPFSRMSGRKAFPLEADTEELRSADFLELLARKLPLLRKSMDGAAAEEFLKKKILLVVNGKPATGRSHVLQNGDEVQVLTPVSGG